MKAPNDITSLFKSGEDSILYSILNYDFQMIIVTYLYPTNWYHIMMGQGGNVEGFSSKLVKKHVINGNNFFY